VVLSLFVVLVWVVSRALAHENAAGRRPGKVSVRSLPMDASVGV